MLKVANLGSLLGHKIVSVAEDYLDTSNRDGVVVALEKFTLDDGRTFQLRPRCEGMEGGQTRVVVVLLEEVPSD